MGLPFDEKQYPSFFHFKNIEECELLHFCGGKKPWTVEGFLGKEAKDIWLKYYLMGPVTIENGNF